MRIAIRIASRPSDSVFLFLLLLLFICYKEEDVETFLLMLYEDVWLLFPVEEVSLFSDYFFDSILFFCVFFFYGEDES